MLQPTRRIAWFLIRVTVPAGIAAANFAGPAAAQAPGPLETAISALVAGIDASPGWAAAYQGLVVTGDRAVITGLVVATEPGEFRAEFGPITVTGYSEAAGGFAVSNVAAPEVHVIGRDIDLKLGAIDIDSLSIPAYAAVVFDPARPFTSMVKAYAVIAQASLAQATVASVELTQIVQGLTSVITYDGLTVSGVANGRIAQMDTGPVTMTAPFEPNTVVHYSMDGISTSDFDINAIVHVFDPDQYVNGRGDRQWMTVLGKGTYANLQMVLPGAAFTLGDFSVEDMRMRQPETSFAPLLDGVVANPTMPAREMDVLAQRHVIDMLSAFSIGRISLTGLDVSASGVDRFHLGGFHIADLSIEGLGEFGVEDVDIVVGGEVSMQLDHFAFGGLKFPAEGVIREALALTAAGREPNPLALIPLLGFVEAAGLRVALPGEPQVKLGRASLRLDGYIGPIPTSIDFDMEGLTVPAALGTPMGMDAVIGELGYREFTLEQSVNILWRESTETIEVNDLHVGISDVGTVRIDFGLQGISRDVIEHPERLAEALEKVMFTGATVKVTDNSIADRLMGYMAKRSNITVDQYRNQVASAVPFFLAILQNAGFQGRIAPALQAFLRVPGTLVVTMTPVEPVSFARILSTATDAPQRLPDLLAIGVEAE